MNNEKFYQDLFKDAIFVAIIYYIFGDFIADILFTILGCLLLMVFGGMAWLQYHDTTSSIIFGGILATLYILIPVVIVAHKDRKYRVQHKNNLP